MADDLFVKRAETFIVEHEGFYYEPKTFVRHKEESYFETSLLRNNGICVGFVPRNENSGVVGWTTSSYGVEGSGELLREGELVLKIPPFSAGDTIACSWDKKSGLVNFFLNRERLGEQLVAPVDARMFPAMYCYILSCLFRAHLYSIMYHMRPFRQRRHGALSYMRMELISNSCSPSLSSAQYLWRFVPDDCGCKASRNYV
uniref:B30.2/SPRY domain-containing protein n=2 Tax=Globodera rostochiensis TaxID=31243 RepID=A0A914H9K3_GLORO